MRGIFAKQGLKKGLILAFALTAGFSLTACSDIDAMFGDDSSADVAADAPVAGDAGAPPTAGLGAAPFAALPAAVPGAAPVATITPIAIENGGNDGKKSQRGLEYDTMSDRLARFIHDEVLPAVTGNTEIKAAYPQNLPRHGAIKDEFGGVDRADRGGYLVERG